jgi:hypothetical protein
MKLRPKQQISVDFALIEGREPSLRGYNFFKSISKLVLLYFMFENHQLQVIDGD